MMPPAVASVMRATLMGSLYRQCRESRAGADSTRF
jgi:hypothetical protein